MQRVNEFAFYELASTIHPLTEYTGNLNYTLHWYALYRTRTALDAIFEARPLHVCLNAAYELRKAIDAAVPRDFNEAVKKVKVPTMSVEEGEPKEQADEQIENYVVYRISQAAKNFETVLAAEAATFDTYFISQKGSYKTPDLIERAEIMFPESIRDRLPSQTIQDIRQAGRCLALDVPTGAGFHILRAIESVMASYYGKVLGRVLPTRMRNWGLYIKKLRHSPKSDDKILDFLDHIRENYRNPIQHPDVFLTADEVEILLGVAVSSIRQMVLAIEKLEESQV